jgi:hypothetical protein
MRTIVAEGSDTWKAGERRAENGEDATIVNVMFWMFTGFYVKFSPMK